MAGAVTQDAVTILADGKEYGGWTGFRAGRGLDRCSSHVELEVTERWTRGDQVWRILPMTPIAAYLGKDLILTGYIDDYSPTAEARQHTVRIVGRSKTEDLIDCTPDLPSGQFTGYSVEAIARALCAPSGIGVVVQTDNAAQVIPETDTRRQGTAWSTIERLCRLATVLATDDEFGRLVLTNAGAARSSGALIEGENILRAQGHFSARKRFSDYIVKGQAGVGRGVGTPATDQWGGAGGLGQPSAGPPPPAAPKAVVQTALEAIAHDGSVPRYRPTVKMAESQMNLAAMQQRANWQMMYAWGRSIQATITIVGWRQPDGRPWALNEIVAVQSDVLGVDRDLLIVSTDFRIDDRAGQVTELRVAPLEGYVPDPSQVKVKHNKGKHGRKGKGTGPGWNWSGAGGS